MQAHGPCQLIQCGVHRRRGERWSLSCSNAAGAAGCYRRRDRLSWVVAVPEWRDDMRPRVSGDAPEPEPEVPLVPHWTAIVEGLARPTVRLRTRILPDREWCDPSGP